MKLVLPILCFVVLGCCFTWSMISKASQREVAAISASASTPEAVQQLVDAELSRGRVAAGGSEVLTAVPPETTALPTPDVTTEIPAKVESRPAVVPLDDEALARKYEGATVVELIKAYRQKGDERNAEGNRLREKIFKEGPFEEKFYPEGSSGLAEKTGPSDGRPWSTVWSTEPVSGGTIIKHATLSNNALYPEFRSLELEAHWLHKKLHEVGGCGCPGA